MSTELPHEETILNGHAVIEQGEPAMAAYLLMDGKAGVWLERDGQKTRIAELKDGDIFGEAALFKGSDYGASVIAEGNITVQQIPPNILDEKIKACDPMIRALIRMLMIRVRKANEALLKP